MSAFTEVVAFIVEPEDWMDQALCAQIGGDEWFPEKGGSIREAKKVCAACPVRQQCLDYALEHQEQYGLWGGKTPLERRRLQPGATPTERQAARDLLARKVRTLISEGHSDPEAAVRLGISDRTVQRIRKEYGIAPHLTNAAHAGRTA